MTDTSVRSPKAQPAYSLRELLGYPHRNEPVAAAHRIASSFGARMIPVAASLVGKNRTA